LDFILCSKRTGPGSVTLLLAIVTIVVVENTHQLGIESLQHCLDLFVFLSIQYFLHLFHTFVQLFIVVCDNDDMKRFKILEYVFLFFVCASATDCDPATTTLFDNFLSFSFRSNNFTDVIGFRIVDRLLSEIYFFEFFERFIVFGRDETKIK
jgi:hypothetical protein